MIFKLREIYNILMHNLKVFLMVLFVKFTILFPPDFKEKYVVVS